MSLLVKEITARIKGDNAAVTAAKIARKCVSSVKSQIASLEAKEVDLEDNVDTAKENLDNAQYPTSTFSSGQTYINNVKEAQDEYDSAEEALEDIRGAITYFKALQKRHKGSGVKPKDTVA